MHGLIAADSFCIPNIRIILSDNIIGKDFKYNDYYSVFGIENHNKIDCLVDFCSFMLKEVSKCLLPQIRPSN